MQLLQHNSVTFFSNSRSCRKKASGARSKAAGWDVIRKIVGNGAAFTDAILGLLLVRRDVGSRRIVSTGGRAEEATLQEIMTGLEEQVRQLGAEAGLLVVRTEAGTDFAGEPTLRSVLALGSEGAKELVLELSAGLDLNAGPEPGRAAMVSGLRTYLAEAATRLRNPRPDCYITLTGLPLSFGKFAWPFHHSTSGADTSIVHGEVRLEDGEASVLHAKVSASMTVTFREVVVAPEQPFAESFIYNAVRKTMDQGQLELVKSGNRQPVAVTTRYYSAKQQRFVFNDTTEAQRQEFLAAKAFWLSGVLGASEPVWLADPRDAQYLNTTAEALGKTAEALASEGLVRLAADVSFATPTAALMGHRAKYVKEMTEALQFLKPTFNEQMRGGHTNM